MEFIELTDKEYVFYLKTYNNKNFLQSIEMGNINKKIGNTVIYLGVKENENILAASLFIIKKNRGRSYYYSPRGLQLDYSNEKLLTFYVEELKKYAKLNNAYMIKIDPNIEIYSRDGNGNKTEEYNNIKLLKRLESLGFKYLNHSIQKKWFYVLDVNNKTEKEIFNNFRSNVKNIIRKCQKIGIEIEELKDDFTRFSNIVQETAERKNFSVRDEEYYSLMKSEFRDNIKIYIAKIDLKKYIEKLTEELNSLEDSLIKIKGDGKKKNCLENINNTKKMIEKINLIKEEHGNEIDLAASMFCLYGEEVVYLFSGSKEEFLFLNAPYLIQWHMIQEAIKKGFSVYNFYGIEDLSDPKVKQHGVYEFKKGFNGKVTETIGELDLYLNKHDKFKYFVKKMFKRI